MKLNKKEVQLVDTSVLLRRGNKIVIEGSGKWDVCRRGDEAGVASFLLWVVRYVTRMET